MCGGSGTDAVAFPLHFFFFFGERPTDPQAHEMRVGVGLDGWLCELMFVRCRFKMMMERAKEQIVLYSRVRPL